jgi:NAD(P)-dependent dehydrogenase (short-subunit alcohol dehydrogenase family)
MNKLEGKIALGTGASRGIGAAIAEPIADFVAFGRPYIAKSAGKPSTGRDHGAIPTIRLSVGRVNSTRGANAHPSHQ